VFTTTSQRRLYGQTRVDNHAMRTVFRRCGFVKEAHYRQDWPRPDGTLSDSVGYTLLRQDWEGGTTTPVVWDDEPAGPQSSEAIGHMISPQGAKR